MRASRISQGHLAQSLQCTRGAISHYLSGRRIPNLQQLEAMAACLEVPPWWLLYGVDEGAIHEGAGPYRPAIPVSGTTESGPTAASAGHLVVPGSSPACYALQVTGTAYAPRIYEGEAVLLDPGIAVQPGDDVVIKFNDRQGVALFNFINSRGSYVTVAELLDSTRRRVLERQQLAFMHSIVAVVRMNSVEPEGGGSEQEVRSHRTE